MRQPQEVKVMPFDFRSGVQKRLGGFGIAREAGCVTQMVR